MRFIQKIIYYLCYLLYKITVKLCHHEVKTLWYRNSFSFDYWVFLKSDIDITVVFEKANNRLVKEVAHTHALFRRFVPVIGELVIYSEAHAASLQECANSFELSRDPFLVEAYDIKKKPDLYEKIIYLHKFIVANWSKKDIDTKRPEKVNFIAEQLGLGSHKKFYDLIDDLGSMLGVDQTEFKASYIKALDNNAENVIYYTFDISNLIYSLFYNQLCYLKPETPLNITEKKVLEKTVLWELWGSFSFQNYIPKDDFIKHKIRLFNQLDQLTSLEFAQKSKKLADDLELK